MFLLILFMILPNGPQRVELRGYPSLTECREAQSLIQPSTIPVYSRCEIHE